MVPFNPVRLCGRCWLHDLSVLFRCADRIKMLRSDGRAALIQAVVARVLTGLETTANIRG